MNTIPDCRLAARTVRQMQDGDVCGVEPWALFGDALGAPWLAGSAPVGECRPGRLTVSKAEGRYHVDASGVDERFQRLSFIHAGSLSVCCVSGAHCP